MYMRFKECYGTIVFCGNRQAEVTFMREAQAVFIVEEVPDVELHEVYQTVDVTVLRLKKEDAPSTKFMNKLNQHDAL